MTRLRLWPTALILILVSIFLASCSLLQQDETNGTDAPVAQATPEFATVTLTPEPTPTATATPEPTPIPRAIKISEQDIDEDGLLAVDLVSLPEDGWLVIYHEKDDQPAEIIGTLPLAAGVYDDAQVEIDIDLATTTMYAGLHADEGVKGVFEYPGADEPWPGEPRTKFAVDFLMPRPQIQVTDQAIDETGTILIERVEVVEPAWVLIHNEDDGVIGPVVGRLRLEAGIYENITTTIMWREATPFLSALLYEDKGESGRLEDINIDPVMLVNGQPVRQSFRVTYPPTILVYDQPLVNNTITIERVISDGPGWLAVYNDYEGQERSIVGAAPLKDGLNELVTIDISELLVTPILYVRIHEDTEPGGPFDFPTTDPPVLNNGRLPQTAPIQLDSRAQVMIKNQVIGDDNVVTVDMIANGLDGWAAVHLDDGGQPGPMIGRTFVSAGLNRNVTITIESGWQSDDSLFFVLYEDRGARGEFDPLGIDPFFVDSSGGIIRVPFLISPTTD